MSRHFNSDYPIDTRGVAKTIDLAQCNTMSSYQRPHPSMSHGRD
jgi:hypothetical protein